MSLPFSGAVSLGSRQHDDGDTKDLLCHLAVMQPSGARRTGRMESGSPTTHLVWRGAVLHPHVFLFSNNQGESTETNHIQKKG